MSQSNTSRIDVIVIDQQLINTEAVDDDVDVPFFLEASSLNEKIFSHSTRVRGIFLTDLNQSGIWD